MIGHVILVTHHCVQRYPRGAVNREADQVHTLNWSSTTTRVKTGLLKHQGIEKAVHFHVNRMIGQHRNVLDFGNTRLKHENDDYIVQTFKVHSTYVFIGNKL